MIVVATEDFELYHDAVAELRDRGVTFTTVEPGDPLPAGTRVVISGPDDDVDLEVEAGDGGAGGRGDGDRARHVVASDGARHAVEEALALLRSGGGRTVVGVDPGDRPGIAVRSGETVIAAFQVPLVDAVEVIRREVADEPDALVRVGDGARLAGARIVNDLDDVAVELVDETGTTPYLGEGVRGMGDVLAAVNIASLEGEPVEGREVEPTAGELQRIKNRSREVSEGDRTIPEGLARRVAKGDLSVEEALAAHREPDGPDGMDEDEDKDADEDENESDPTGGDDA